MKLLKNTGAARVIDELSAAPSSPQRLDSITPSLCLFAVAALRKALHGNLRARLVLPSTDPQAIGLFGDAADRPARNRLQVPYLARELARWLRERGELRLLPGPVQQGLITLSTSAGAVQAALVGSCGLHSPGLGLAPSTGFSLVQTAEGPGELSALAQLFEQTWAQLPARPAAIEPLLAALDEIAAPPAAALVYARVLHAIFGAEEGLGEERVLRAGTGLRSSVVWSKLYRFQRDGVIGVIDKLERYGGCILADSVGLGKTFEALAVIRYHELRNDRVLVLCPKRLRDNWTLYRQNDRRNILLRDRFNYDVLNHTDLGRTSGQSGDIDLSTVNLGNYDLIVIDESHNFRNRPARRDRDTRYDVLMRRVIREGVKTRVLMLSATPVNNRLADLKNQIAFITEGQDDALREQGIPSIETTTRLAQLQFNNWMKGPESQRTTPRLLEMLGFDYFRLLDLLTIARSRRHIERYYGSQETGRFPERNRPINVKSDLDTKGELRPVREINQEIRRLNLSVYAPLRYVLPHRRAAYDAKYSTAVREGRGQFQQSDREESLIHLLRVNVLKRMESSVQSFVRTLHRLHEDIDRALQRLEEASGELGTFDFGALQPSELELTDPRLEALLVGEKVKVLVQDVDALRWRQDLQADRERLRTLLRSAEAVNTARDAKLRDLKAVIEAKLAHPFNPGNRKVLVFTAFADTATYLYEALAGWAQALGLQMGLVTGSGRNRSTLANLRLDMGALLSAFSPRSKERPAESAAEGELDLLIATDCISEGQNLQDCDTVINYDIHWNPVRIIQRFGRIDRLGSTNSRIQLINFWPNLELEEYIGLEQRVAGRMALMDLSATGEENLMEATSGDAMNDLEYRRRQLMALQESVVDMEGSGVGLCLTDLSLADLRVDLARIRAAQGPRLDRLPPGLCAVVAAPEVPPGLLFCLRAEGEGARALVEAGDPLAPHLLVYVGEDGVVLHPHTQAKASLDLIKRLAAAREAVDPAALARFQAETRDGERMERLQRALANAVSSVNGKAEARGVESLFSPGGTQLHKGELAGLDDIEVVAVLVVLAEPAP